MEYIFIYMFTDLQGFKDAIELQIKYPISLLFEQFTKDGGTLIRLKFSFICHAKETFLTKCERNVVLHFKRNRKDVCTAETFNEILCLKLSTRM